MIFRSTIWISFFKDCSEYTLVGKNELTINLEYYISFIFNPLMHVVHYSGILTIQGVTLHLNHNDVSYWPLAIILHDCPYSYIKHSSRKWCTKYICNIYHYLFILNGPIFQNADFILKQQIIYLNTSFSWILKSQDVILNLMHQRVNFKFSQSNIMWLLH